MNKKFRVLLVIALVIVMVSMAGCGASTSKSDEDQTSTEPAATEETAMDEATGDDAASADTSLVPADGEFVIGFACMANTDTFCKYCEDQFVALVEEKAPNWEVNTADGQMDSSMQMTQVEAFITKGVDAIVLQAVDGEASIPAVEKANDANIPVICLITNANGGDHQFIASDNVDCGKAQAEYMNENLPQDANIVIIRGVSGLQVAEDRFNGFMDNFDRPDVTILADLDGQFSRTTGMEIMQDWLQTYPEIDGVVCGNDEEALGAIQALKSANRLEGTIISGVDGTQDGLNAVIDGDLTMTMLYNGLVQVENCFNSLIGLSNGQELGPDVITPFELVTKDNAQEYFDLLYGSAE